VDENLFHPDLQVAIKELKELIAKGALFTAIGNMLGLFGSFVCAPWLVQTVYQWRVPRSRQHVLLSLGMILMLA